MGKRIFAIFCGLVIGIVVGAIVFGRLGYLHENRSETDISEILQWAGIAAFLGAFIGALPGAAIGLMIGLIIEPLKDDEPS